MTPDERLEAAARAAWEWDDQGFPERCRQKWEEGTQLARATYVARAEAALAAAYPELTAGTHWLAPMEMMEAAARAICELDPQSPGPDEPIMIGSKRAKAWEPRAEIIREAIKLGLFAWPPKAWLAPMEAAPSIAEALDERRRADDLWSTDELWSAARDAYLREGGK